MPQRVMTFKSTGGDWLYLDLLSKDVWLIYGELRTGNQNIVRSGTNLEYGVSMALYLAEKSGFALQPCTEVG